MQAVGRIAVLAGSYVETLEVWLPQLLDAEDGRRRAHRALEVAINNPSADIFAARALYKGTRHRCERALCVVREAAEMSGRLLGSLASPSPAERSDVTMIQVRFANSVADWTDADALDRAEQLVASLPEMSLLCTTRLAELIRLSFTRLGLSKKDRAVRLLDGLDAKTAKKELQQLSALHGRATDAVSEILRALDHETVTVDLANRVIGERAERTATMTAA